VTIPENQRHNSTSKEPQHGANREKEFMEVLQLPIAYEVIYIKLVD